MSQFRFDGLKVAVEVKPIKNIHLAVYPPEGRIRIAAPLGTTMEQVYLLLVKRRPWIRKQRNTFNAQKRETEREYEYRESHYFKGRQYLLRIHPCAKINDVEIKTKTYLEVFTRKPEDKDTIQMVLDTWLREQLRLEARRILIRIGTDVPQPKLIIRNMSRKWGSYSRMTHTVTLNLQLIKKPVECIEYVLVHELTHYAEDKHGTDFVKILASKLPDWERRRELLNSLPLSI